MEMIILIKTGVLILAGGNGQRYKGKKQFELLRGKPLWKTVYDKANHFAFSKENIIVVGVDVEGGRTRTESVKIGLYNLQPDTDRVIILEAARPLVTLEQIQTLYDNQNDSVTFIKPLVNTIVKKDGTYVNRSDFYELLTPQAFNYKKLKFAYSEIENQSYTDETRIMFEKLNIKPHFIEGDDNLFKVTYPNDLIIIKNIFERMSKK